LKYILIFFIILMTNNFAKNLKIINRIESKYEFISYFTILYNENNEYDIAVFSYDENINRTSLEIFDKHNKCIFRKELGEGSVMLSSVVRENNKLIFFLNKLYLFDNNNFLLDSLELKNKEYTTIQLKNDILIANSKLNVDLYSINAFNLINSFNRKESSPWDLPKLQDSLMIFKNFQNELVFLNINNKKRVDTVNTGETELKLLGIKVLSGKDAITDYKINDNLLYFVTIGGSIYKYDIKLKKIVALRKSFMGDENNAGLINNFKFTDANLDGNIDFVGAAVDNNIYCINGKDLTTIWQYNTGNENQHPIFLYDVNKDSIPEVFGVTYYDQKLYIIDGKSGTLLYDKKDLNNKGKWTPTSVFVDDLNKDGNINIVCESGVPKGLIILELIK